MHVVIYIRGEDPGEPMRPAGRLVLRDGVIRPEPPGLLLDRLLERPIVVYKGEEEVTYRASEDPVGFLRHLAIAYSGSALRAGKAVEDA